MSLLTELGIFLLGGFLQRYRAYGAKRKAAPVFRSGFVVARHFLLLLIRFLNLRHYRPINLRAGIGHGGIHEPRRANTITRLVIFPQRGYGLGLEHEG